MLGFLEERGKIRIAVGVEQAEPGEVAFRAELLGGGGEEKDGGRLPGDFCDERVARAWSFGRPFEVMRFIDDEQIPTRLGELERAFRGAGGKRRGAEDELAIEKRVRFGIVRLDGGAALFIERG